MSGTPSRQGYQFGTLSGEVIAACIAVQSELGRHCMEVDYQRALEVALRVRGLAFDREVEVPIVYKGIVVTRRRVDFIVWREAEELLLETKASSAIRAEDVEQCLLYLKQTGQHLCLLINFGQKPLGIKRLVGASESHKASRP